MIKADANIGNFPKIQEKMSEISQIKERFLQYVDYKGQTIVATENILVKKYLVVGSHTRFEDYETGTGCFYLE